MELTSEDEEVKHLVGASLPAVASGEGEASGVESTFFLEVMVDWGGEGRKVSWY